MKGDQITDMSISKDKKRKRGNDLVDMHDFRRRLEEVTGHKAHSIVEEEADLPDNTLSKIYRGDIALTVDHLLRISNKYKCSIDYLLGNDVPKGSRENDINVADFVDMIHALHNMGSVKLLPKSNWTASVDFGDHSETVKVSSSAILIANANLESIMQDYIKLKKGLDVIDGSLHEEVYSSFLNTRRKSNVSIKGATIPEHELQKEQYGYYD